MTIIETKLVLLAFVTLSTVALTWMTVKKIDTWPKLFKNLNLSKKK